MARPFGETKTFARLLAFALEPDQPRNIVIAMPLLHQLGIVDERAFDHAAVGTGFFGDATDDAQVLVQQAEFEGDTEFERGEQAFGIEAQGFGERETLEAKVETKGAEHFSRFALRPTSCHTTSFCRSELIEKVF